MLVTRCVIKKVVPKDGLIGFASIVLDDKLFLSNIAIFSRLNQEGKYRLVFPEKKTDKTRIRLFYPITNNFYFELEKYITEEINK